jgi:hypothetical protein
VSNRGRGLDLDLHILGREEAVITRTRMTKVGRGEHHQEFGSTTHSIDYALHPMHVVEIWHFEGGNLPAGVTFQSKGRDLCFGDYDQQ